MLSNAWRCVIEIVRAPGATHGRPAGPRGVVSTAAPLPMRLTVRFTAEALSQAARSELPRAYSLLTYDEFDTRTKGATEAAAAPRRSGPS